MENEFNFYNNTVVAYNTFKERAKYENENTVPFGVSFLDDALGGIAPSDVILIGGGTGGGKTQLAAIIAANAAGTGKRVLFYALEAELHEIGDRLMYSKFCTSFYAGRPPGDYDTRYSTFKKNQPEKYIAMYDTQIKEFSESLSNLKVKYPTDNFTVEDLDRSLIEARNNADIIVIDHLHYFDLDQNQENAQMKLIIKKLRNFALIYKIPVILVAHIRKQQGGATKVVPDGDDFHGSSDVLKMSTKAIMLSSSANKSCAFYNGASYEDFNVVGGTIIRVAKYRRDGSVPHYLGLLRFNKEGLGYDDDYFLGNENWNGKRFYFSALAQQEMPKWAKRAKGKGKEK